MSTFKKIYFIVLSAFLLIVLACFGDILMYVLMEGGVILLAKICAIPFFYFGLFFFTVYFIGTYKTWDKKTRQSYTSFLVLYFCINIFLVFGRFGYVCVLKNGDARERRCFSNILSIWNAVELYNMKSYQMMEKLDIPLLIKEKFLKEKEIIYNGDCAYFSVGNISDDGFIYCPNHGNLKIKSEEMNLSDSDFFKRMEEKKIYTTPKEKELLIELRKELPKAKLYAKEEKKIRENNRTIIEKTGSYLRKNIGKFIHENKVILGVVLAPILIPFFPFFYHPVFFD